MEKELLVIVAVLRESRSMLLDTKINIYTDNKNLTFATFNTQIVLRWRCYPKLFLLVKYVSVCILHMAVVLAKGLARISRIICLWDQQAVLAVGFIVLIMASSSWLRSQIPWFANGIQGATEPLQPRGIYNLDKFSFARVLVRAFDFILPRMIWKPVVWCVTGSRMALLVCICYQFIRPIESASYGHSGGDFLPR